MKSAGVGEGRCFIQASPKISSNPHTPHPKQEIPNSRKSSFWNSGPVLGPCEKSLLCEEAKREHTGSGQILLIGDSWRLGQERVFDRKGILNRACLRGIV